MTTEQAPKSFNLTTAAEDFAGPGRKVECPVRVPGEVESGLSERPFARRQMLLTVNGWTFSAIWGLGTYCTAARPDGSPGSLTDPPPEESPDAEIAVWKDDGPMIELHGDTVEGWVSPASLLDAIAAAEQDDLGGIRSALVRSEDDQ